MPPIDPDHLSPTGRRVTPHPRPGAEQEAAFERLTGLTVADAAAYVERTMQARKLAELLMADVPISEALAVVEALVVANELHSVSSPAPLAPPISGSSAA